jgi:hypothetical protein
MTKDDHDSCPSNYTSKFENWDQVASVRAKPRRLLAEEEANGKLFFPPELVPTSKHRLILDQGEQAIKKMLVRRLYQYLDFTTILEHGVVNRVTQQIAQGRLGISLPEQMEFDAYKIYCDEGYHALFSVDLKRQVALVTHIAPGPIGTPRFLQRLEYLKASMPPELHDMVEVFFTIVSETLISAILSKIPKDTRIVSAVREMVADHAEDEGRHHAYFSKLLEFLWPQLDSYQQTMIGPLLPKFILGFLEPDYDAIKQGLAEYRLRPAEIDSVMYEVYSATKVVSEVKESARATLRLFERNSLLVDGPTLEAFQRSGLIK